MSRNQIVVHLRNNKDFSLEELIKLEDFLCEQDVLCSVDFDGHDHGSSDSNIFLFSNDLEGTIDIIAKSIETFAPDLNFAVGAKAEGAEAEYDLIASKGVYEITIR